jgi:hypothetical protein
MIGLRYADASGDRHKHRYPHRGIDGVKKVWAITIETVRHLLPEGQSAFVLEGVDHLDAQPRLGMKSHIVGYLALLPSLRIGVAEPLFRYEKPFVHQCIAMP